MANLAGVKINLFPEQEGAWLMPAGEPIALRQLPNGGITHRRDEDGTFWVTTADGREYPLVELQTQRGKVIKMDEDA